MKIRIIRDESPHAEFFHAEDVASIVDAMAGAGYECSADEARELWELHSDMYAAGWLGLPDTDGEIVECLTPFFVIVEMSVDS
jgi:hypothetical protein